ncbi:MAG TPA: TerB family tellurite resistance protein [Gemmatimonadales bacterium]
MLDAIKNLLARRTASTSSTGPGRPAFPGVQVAAGALLLELAHADGEFSEAERTHIQNALARHFALDEATTRELLALAAAERAHSIDHFQFARAINEQYDLAQKMVLAEVMWGVILADGSIAEHEAYLVRKLANLLDLEPGYLAQARRAASSGS